MPRRLPYSTFVEFAFGDTPFRQINVDEDFVIPDDFNGFVPTSGSEREATVYSKPLDTLVTIVEMHTLVSHSKRGSLDTDHSQHLATVAYSNLNIVDCLSLDEDRIFTEIQSSGYDITAAHARITKALCAIADRRIAID